MYFDIVLEKCGMLVGNIDISRVYRMKFQAWPDRLMISAHTLTRRGEETEMRPPRLSKGDEFDQLMGLELLPSINRQTQRSKPMAIPTLLTLFALFVLPIN